MPAAFDDRQAMTRIAAGDRQAFASFLEHYLDTVVDFARRYVQQQSDAEDIAQETFLRVWKHADKYHEVEGATPRSWLYRLCYNLCMDALRRLRPGHDIEDHVIASDPYHGPEQTVLRDARLKQLQDAISTLNLRQYTALSLCVYEGLSNKEAASAMEISVDALESLLARARRNLRERLQLK